MRRICCLALLIGNLVFTLLLGCNQHSADDSTPSPNAAAAPVNNPLPAKARGDQAGQPAPDGPQDAWQQANFPGADPNQEKYDAALHEAIEMLAVKKYVEALASMEAAFKFKDTELVQTEMKKLRLRIEQQDAAESTLRDIQTLFDEGKVTEAGQLATEALKEYGATDVAPDFVKLKLQADALSIGGMDDNAARHKAFRQQGDAAQAEGNLRAAALAYEQALQLGEDPQLRKTCDELRTKLAKYDDNRQKAAELRQDSATLDDALTTLQDAAKEWDTPEIRQQIDEYTLAQQNRRDRIAIADFEVRGDIGIPMAGRAIPEELLPYFKGRFDIVERGQIAKVLDELKLEAGALGINDQDQQEIGKLAKVRYLVLGSVMRIGGTSVNARLVDVQTGLVVQTAKITAASPDELMAHLSELAKLLLMSDDQQIVYQQELAKQAQPVPVVQVDQPLPPPPEPPGAAQPLPPVEIVDANRPPEIGGVKVEDVQRFQPLAEGQPPPVIVYGGDPEELWKRKAMYASVYLGDTLYRRGRYVEAMRRFEFGLVVAPGFFELDIRITRCRPWLPPPPVFIVVPAPPPPRVAILDFAIVGNPGLVPPEVTWWTPRALAPYFSPPYQVADPGEVYWWMGRMGMTVRDVMVDPYARRWLGRALNIRYFVFGTVIPTASFNVETYMVDAEHGQLIGRGFIHVHSRSELRYRIGELARMTQGSPLLWKQQQQEFVTYEGLIVKARVAADRGQLVIAIGFLGDALRLRPRSAEALVYLDRLERLNRQRILEAQRRKDFERQQQFAIERRLRQEQLAREAERQRILAAQAAAALSVAQRQALEQQRLAAQLAAHNQLLVQGRIAFKANNFTLSIQTFESALRIRQDDAVFVELARARAELERVNRLRQLDEARERDLKVQLQKAKDLAAANARLAEERQKRLLEETALLKAREKRDEVEFARLIAEGGKSMTAKQFNAAISSFQAARRLKKTDQVDSLLNQATLAQAHAVADAKGPGARQDLEKQLALEKDLRLKAESEAQDKQAKYLAFLKTAQKAYAGRDYPAAIANYNEAGRIFKTDAVLTGLQQAQSGLDKTKAESSAVKEKQVADQNKLVVFQTLMNEGQAAMQGKDYGKAVEKFSAARKVQPTNIDALAALTKAEQARDAAGVESRTKSQGAERLKMFNRLLKDGQENLAGKQYAAAVASLTEALKLNPGDPAATKMLKTAQDAFAANVKTADQIDTAKKNTAEYQKAITDGRLALQNKQFDAAIKAFGQAQKLLPGDLASQNLLKDAQKQKDDFRAAEIAAAKKRAESVQLQLDLQKALSEGRSALAAKNFAGADKALSLAVMLAPTDPSVTLFQRDLQKAKDAARADAELQQKRKTQYDVLMAEGKKALDEKRFDAAIQALSHASALLPGDKNSLALLQLARQGQQAGKVVVDPNPKKGMDDLQKLTEFNRLMKEGNALLTSKRFGDAVNSFSAAAKLMPGDQNAAKALQLANQLWAESKTATSKSPTSKAPTGKNPTGKTPTGPTAAQMAEYNRLMQIGAGFDKQKKYDDAVKSYDAALMQIPKDAKAAEAKKKSTYHIHMTEGNRLQSAKKNKEAIVQYEAALRLYPMDPEATAALKRAKEGK